MKEMVISFFPDGSVQHTLKDPFFKPLENEEREVERMSDIRFNRKRQAFYIKLLKMFKRDDGSIFPDVRIDPNILEAYGLGHLLNNPRCRVSDDLRWLTFPSYETAVDFEIELINEMRLKGWRVV